MASTEASWWNILNLKIFTTLDYIVSQILLNLRHVFRFRIVGTQSYVSTYAWVQEDSWNNITKSCVTTDDEKAKHVSQVQED